MCADTRPMNEMGPPIAIATAHSTATTTKPAIRTTSGLMPIAVAMSSPSASPLSGTASAIPMTAATAATTSSGAISAAERIVSEPTCQKRNESSTVSLDNTSACVIPLSTAPNATPARMSRTGEPSTNRELAIATITALASTAPASAKNIADVAPAEPSTMIAMTTPSAAPELTPSRPESASGLRVSACMSTPATPSAAPHASPAIVRLTRSSPTIITVPCSPTPSSADATSARGIDFAPIARLSTTAAKSSAHSTTAAANPSAGRARRFCGTAQI